MLYWKKNVFFLSTVLTFRTESCLCLTVCKVWSVIKNLWSKPNFKISCQVLQKKQMSGLFYFGNISNFFSWVLLRKKNISFEKLPVFLNQWFIVSIAFVFFKEPRIGDLPLCSPCLSKLQTTTEVCICLCSHWACL